MENKNNTSDLMNYVLENSNSNNYNSSTKTSSPESFPDLMDNGIIVEYKSTEFSTEIVEESLKSE